MAFLWSEDLETAVRNAVSLGGDADTIAAITGSIAEALYGGVPEHIKKEVLRRAILDEFKDVLSRFSKAIQGETRPREDENSQNTDSIYKAVIFDFDGTFIDTTSLDDITTKSGLVKMRKRKSGYGRSYMRRSRSAKSMMGWIKY